MAVKFVIVLLINSVITNDLVLSNGVGVPNLIPSENPLASHEEVTLFNNQVTENHDDNVIELQKEHPTACHSTAVLIPMLNQLLNLLMEDPSNINKVSRISALLQEYLRNIPDGQNYENSKLSNEESGFQHDTLRTAYYDGLKGRVKTKIVFKYDLPSINQPHCKDVFLKLIKSAHDAYVQLAKNPMCQTSNILEALLKKPYEAPYYNWNSNPNPILPSKKDDYSIYDLLKPHQQRKVNNRFYQKPINANDLTSIDSSYKPVNLNDGSQNIKDILGSKPNNLYSDNQIPNFYDLNAYGHGINPTAVVQHDTNYYIPESIPKASSNYNADINFNMYGINKNNQITQNKNSNSLLSDLNKLNSNLDTVKLLENNSKLPLHILLDSINGINKNPQDSIMSILPTDKTPYEKDEMQNNPIKLINQLNYPNINQNDVQNGQNVYYPYLPNQDNHLVYQHMTPVDSTNQVLVTNLGLPNQYITQNSPINKYMSSQYGIPNKINTVKPYLQNVYNNYLHKLNVIPNNQQINGVPNASKLDPSANASVIELTYVVKSTTPLIYQPSYFVKFRIPYSTFLQNINNLLLTKPYLKNNPLKLYQELIALSNVSDISPALKGYKKEDILQLAYKNGELTTAKLVKDDIALNDKLKLIQTLNSGIGAADIEKLSNKYNGLLRNSLDKGNSSDSVGIGRYGSIMTPYYDLSSSGIGFNAGLINSYESRQALPTNTISSIYFGTNAIHPNQLSSGLTRQKPALGTFSLFG